MAINTSEEYKRILQNIVSRTEIGEIEWAQVNPSTFSWAASNGQISIQSVEKKRTAIETGRLRTVVEKTHILSASDSLGRQQVRIDGSEDKQMEPKLRTLYQLAADSVAKKGLNFLKKLLGE